MRRLLWCGDAGCDTGFARCTHKTLDVLRQSWDVTVLGLNYLGDPHGYPYPIYPCWPGGDAFGQRRIAEIAAKVKADAIVLQNDPWNVAGYMDALKKAGLAHVPVVGALAVDGANCRGRELNGLAGAIFWTRFALRAARKGGYTGNAAVVPLGVDLDIYRPMDRIEARRAMGFRRVTRSSGDGATVELPLDAAFIVGNVNRNQPRKRLDLTIAYFAEWVRERNIEDAYLYLHVAPTGEAAFDCQQMAEYFGVLDRLILTAPEIWHGYSEEQLRATYACFDVQATTTQGEGWGLTTMEGMACGIPQLLPDWSALGEWAADAALTVPCTSTVCTPNGINTVGGVPDRDAFIAGLDALYHDRRLREELREKGLALVQQPRYRWPAIGAAFATAIDRILAQRVDAPAGEV